MNSLQATLEECQVSHELEHTYTSDYALLTVTRNGQTFNYNYDLAGRLTSLEYPASTGIIATYNWDIDSNLLGIEYASGATNLQSFSYGYDNSQSRTSCTDVNGFDSITTNWKYGYDWFSRLAGVTRNADLNLYSFDESDNRTQLQKTLGGVTSTFNYSYGADNRLTSRALAGGGTDTFSSDPDGNLTSVTGTASASYLWNNSDKLVRVQTSAGSETNSYGAEGLRRSKEPNTLYYNSDSTAVSDNATNPVSYIQGHQILGFQVGSIQYYYLPDVLGSIRHVVDSSGARKFSVQYDEFGSATVNDQTGGTPSYLAGLCQQLTFVGAFGVRNETATTGMYLMGERWYNPITGRFVTQDPIGFNGGLNLYAYVKQAPSLTIDPSGLGTPPFITQMLKLLWEGKYFDSGIFTTGPVAEAIAPEAAVTLPPLVAAVGPVLPPAGIAAAIYVGTAALAPEAFGQIFPYPIPGTLPQNTQSFLQNVAGRAENRIGGVGAVCGTNKHAYAERMINKYQSIYGPVGEGLGTERSYLKGDYIGKSNNLAGSVRLDVVEGPESNPKAVYDFKFTVNPNPTLSTRRTSQMRNVAGLNTTVPIVVIHP